MPSVVEHTDITYEYAPCSSATRGVVKVWNYSCHKYVDVPEATNNDSDIAIYQCTYRRRRYEDEDGRVVTRHLSIEEHELVYIGAFEEWNGKMCMPAPCYRPRPSSHRAKYRCAVE